LLAGRLIYGGLQGLSGEVFARVDHGSGIFVKGYLGAGEISNGHLHDEDFPGFNTTYSNTLSSASGHLGYATIDVGYDVWNAAGAKVGPFVGYNYYTQAIENFGCTQIAGSPPCSPALASALLGLTESDSFNSLRVGLSSQIMLIERLRLTADAAYVPWVSFSGTDDRLLRQLLLLESAHGNGVMLEASLDYFLTPAWRVGVGARYWAWNTSTGSVIYDFLAAPPLVPETARFTTERYGVFAQSSYRWGDPPPPANEHPILAKAAVVASAPMNWTGFYVGGHLGGGWSDAQWSDPFGSTVGPGGFVNVAGFGDSTHATGPLGGGQIGANWQTGRLVLGVEADADAANMRGENTCFSGLGGINCQHALSALGTITGRVGYAWDRSLAYAKGGAAWTEASYNLSGNTIALSLGTGGTTLDRWGWTAGGGIEYALTNHSPSTTTSALLRRPCRFQALP
jgi:hypothetical protein